MVELLTQAQDAAQQENWSAVVNFLQQCLAEPLSDLDRVVTEQVVNLALQVLESGEFQERWDVSNVFHLLGEATIVPLVALLQNEEADLDARWFAARILGHLDQPSAIYALAEQLQGAEDEELSRMASEALANLGAPAIPALTTLLASEPTRSLAIQALAQIHHPETLDSLLAVVADPQPTIRAMTIDVLASFHDPRVAEVLLQAIHDPAPAVRRAAIAGLGTWPELIDAVDLVNQLSPYLWDLNLGVCHQTALTLGRLRSDRAVPVLQRGLFGHHLPESLQVEIVRALGWIGSSNAQTALQDAFNSDALNANVDSMAFNLYREMIRVLGCWSDPGLKSSAAQILLQALNSHPLISNNLELQKAIATALGELRLPIAIDPLIQLLAQEDVGVQLHVIAALKAIDPETSLNRLHQLQASQGLSEQLLTGVMTALREWQTESS